MVFESIVVDILNKYLGKYFENLDPSQLKLGIWGGDVVLENLRIQSNAVKEFNVPFQIAFGFLGKLTLKIPWKNLYKEPVVATVDGLYLLLVPDDDDTYDEAAELKLESDAKQEKLKEIMELESKQASGKEESQDGFVEKLTSQIIRNVQIRIQNIHIRYEDQSTNTQHPFAAGVKLKNLHFETTDENWIPTLLDAPVENIYKLVDLQGLSLYWNASPKDYYKDFPPSEQLSLFKQSFGDKDLSTEYTYILKPIQLKARLKLDPKANVNLQPKIFITLVIEEVGFQLSHQQYHGIVVATDNIDRMSINARFRKYKPNAPLTPAKWWIYAYRSVVGTIVANSRKLSWVNIKKHRDNVHQYKALYKQKLEEKTPNQGLLDQLLKAEDALDIFNITLTRKQAEIELVREGSEILNAEYLLQHNKQSSSSWFSGWFSSKSSKPEKPKEPEGLDSVMTASEKKELYQSIGYIEGELLDDSDLPKSYVKTHLTVSLKKVSLELCNKKVCAEDILQLCFYGINLVVKQRPSAKAVRLTGDLESLAMYGVPQNNQTPTIVAHDVDSTTKQSLFHFDFETNPLDETCDQRLVADSKPVTMVYDAVTVNNLTTFFKPPENTRLQRLRTVAASTYNDVKNQTTTGLKHIIKNKQITQINVHFSSSRFVLPKDGTVQSNSHALVLDLGELIVVNNSCFDEKSVDNRGVAEIQSRIYDAFNINVKNIQLVLSRKGEEPTSSNLHILEPINISLCAEKCLVENDSSLPVIKVTGSLPSVALKLSDLKLLQIIQLVESIPLPPEQPISDVEEIEVESWPATMTDTDDVTLVEKTISKHFDESIVLQQSGVDSSSDEEFFSAESECEEEDEPKKKSKKSKKAKLVKQNVQKNQVTNLQLDFTISQISICLDEEYYVTNIVELISLNMNVLSVHISVRTWDTNMKLSLETFDVVQPQFQTADNTPLVLMNSEVSSDSDTLFHGEIIQVNPKSPDFVQLYNRTKQLVFVRFGSLCITAHVQAVLKLQSFVSSLTHLLESQAAKVIEPTVAAHETSEKSDLATKSDVSIIPSNVKDSDSKVVDLKLTARIDAVRVNLVDEKEEISIVEIEGIKSSVSITKQWIKLNAELHKLKVTDTDIKTLYPDVVQSDGDEVILLEFVNYHNPNTGVDSDVNKPHAVDGSLKLKLGCVKVVFLNKFVEKLQKYGNSLSQGKEILEAGSAAQEIAVAKAQELMLTNPLILIDMKLSAPTIIVPKHSQSLEVLVVDLGVLKAVNQFSQTSVLDIGSRVVDELKLSLHDVQVLYRDVNEDKVVVREENILQPTDLEIEVIRNLSSAWFHGIPDVSVNAVLHKLSVSISQQNLKFILQALELNFQEGTTDAMEEKSESNSDSKTTIVSEQSLPLQESPQEDRDLLHVSFRLENMELKLFVDEKREEDLSKLSFVNIVGSMRDASDLSRVLTLSLEDLLLVDNREHHTGVVTHLIKRKQTVDNGSVLINMKYNQRVDNADGEIEVSNLSLIISVEFYLKLASFFMDGFNVVSEKQSSTSQALQTSSETDLKKLPQKSESSDSQKSVNNRFEINQRIVRHVPNLSNKSSSKMTVNMNDLEILIIRDFHSTQSEAFILALNSTLKYDESGKTQLIDANVRDLTMVRCLYETFVKQKQLGKSRFKEILSPCNISAHGLMTETVQDFHLSINDIQLKISPSVVTTFNDILAQLYPITEQGGNASTKNTTAGRPAFNFSSMKIQDLNSKVMSEVKSTSVDPPTVAARNVIRETGNLSIRRIQVQLEVGCGQHTIPLLLLQLSLNATVEDWSAGEMSGDCTLTMVAAYFNDNLSVWEPLVEPVEKNPGTLEAKYEPWKVRARLEQKDQDNQRFLNSDEPLMVFTIESEQVLETNISNTGLKVINTLTSNFMGDTSADEFQNNKSLTQSRLRIQQESAAFVVTNYLGRNINFIHGDGLTVVGDSLESDSGWLTSKPNKQILLDYSTTNNQDLWSMLSIQKSEQEKNKVAFCLKADDGNSVPINILNTNTSMYSLSAKEDSHVVVSVESKSGVKYINLQSHVVLHNHLIIKIEIYDSESNEYIGVVNPNQTFAIPILHVKDGTVSIRPVYKNNESSLCKLSWSSWVAGGSPETELLRSKPENASSQLILLKVKFEDKLLPFQSSEGKKAVDIHFRTEAILCNFLPIPINYSVLGIAYEGFVNQLESAHSAQLLDLEISKSKLKVKIPSYQGQSWSAVLDLQENMNELTDWTFSNAENKGINLNLAKRITYTNGVLKVELFSPYWLMNHTGLVLDYKSNVDNIVMQSRNENIMLFAFSSRSFLSKNKLQLRVCNSEFSDGFTIDAVGSSGFVTCKSKSCNYIIGTEIMMSSFSLTKVIVFKPFYRFSNKSTLDVEFSVSGLKVPVWHTVESGKVVPFWPEVSSSTLVVRLKNTTSASDKITFNKMESGFLFKISNTTLFVDVSLSECSNIISVRDYFEGSSALLVINDTPDNNLVFRHDKNEEVISAGHARHLLWSTPSNNRKFQWVYCNEQNTIDIAFNKLASFKCNETMIYYVIFSDGLQKSFLLTTNEKRAHFTESFFKFEKPTLQLNVSLHGLVCSFIDSTLHQEVATMSVISSGVVWEEKQNKRWKALPVKYNNFLEDVYQKQLKGHGSAGTVSLDKYEFDLMKMQTKKPNQKDLQRSFSAGIWMRVNSSEHQKSFHAKINKVQIDSQLFGAVFPVILNPVPLPASVAVDNVAKPFIELSMMQEVTENEAVFHVKYCKVLIQEFSVKLDMGLLTSILPVFGGNEDEIDDNEVVKYFAEDLQFLANDKSSSSSASNSIIYFDQLHLSPLKVHISLSMQNKVEDKEDSSLVKLPFNALYVLMQSIGITLSDMDDIVFKLAYFERRFQFFNGSELQDSVMSHYKGQAIKQLYVLVFGLDVIGNPYGLVMGLADGVTSLFYEPYQGMIQGPEEFFEGLGLGTLNLLGQTLGGAAGAVSKVTGALGKGIATITMDDEYQKKRLEAKNKQPANMKESLARGGKGAVMGLFSGVTGIVSKPIEGAKKGGASGFFKGVGKGLVGVVARPVSGVIDLASTTLEGVQRVTDMTEEVRKLRPARWINPETGIIQPYSLKHATGFAIFNEIEKGKFVEDNHYVDHVPTRADDKSVVLITDKLLMVAHTGEILGQWKSDWFCNFQDILAEPTLVDKVLTVEFKENQKFFPRNRSNQNTVTIPNESNARYIHARIVDMWKRSTI